MFVGDSLRSNVSINGLFGLLRVYCLITYYSNVWEIFILLKLCTQMLNFYLLWSFLLNILSITYRLNAALGNIVFLSWPKLVFICRFQAPDLEVKLSDELAGSLRQLKVLDNLSVLIQFDPLTQWGNAVFYL